MFEKNKSFFFFTGSGLEADNQRCCTITATREAMTLAADSGWTKPKRERERESSDKSLSPRVMQVTGRLSGEDADQDQEAEREDGD